MPKNDVLLMVGTTKGAFLIRSGPSRARWKLEGPHFPGEPVYAMALDTRGRRRRGRLYAATGNMHWGATLRRSDDLGNTWSDPQANPIKFPEDAGVVLEQIWQIAPGRADEPDTIYCGVAPAALFVSRDGGERFELVRGLFEHPHRPRWQPGGGGLCLHTILPHPTDHARMLVAVSSAGVYRTSDGGASWASSNQGIRAEFLPDKHPEFGQCVHKVVRHPAAPEQLFLQNHWGLYRSEDDGASWRDIANGVPSDFGFAMGMHPRGEAVYIVPLQSDGFRCTPEGKLRVYRTRDGGASWKPARRGLPQKNAFETVLRDALATDALSPAGVYFGTRSGKLFASRDDGDSWKLLFDGLPPIVCVKVAAVA
jgi:photosystem II stability/assembly factor-like uncharacterized protein